MKNKLILLILVLLTFTLLFVGCDALGIKQADTETATDSENMLSNSLDNQISASAGQQSASEEILRLQKEIDELVSVVNTKDINITELENKLQALEDEKADIIAKSSSIEMELSNLKETISVNKQYRNIAIIVAIISVLFNVLLAYLVIRARIRNKRVALPPAKEDAINDINKEEKENEATSNSENIESITEEKAETTTDTYEQDNHTTKRRGRPKKINNN